MAASFKSMDHSRLPSPLIDIGIPRENDWNGQELSIADVTGSKKEQTIGLGQAMFTLLEANNQTWLSSFKRLRQKADLNGKKLVISVRTVYYKTNLFFFMIGHFENALATLEKHVERDSSSQKDLLDSIIDKVRHTYSTMDCRMIFLFILSLVFAE